MIPEPHHPLCVQNSGQDVEEDACDCATWRTFDISTGRMGSNR